VDFHHSKPTPPAPRSPSPPPHNPLSSKDKPARPPQPTSPPPPPAAPKIMGNRRYQLKGRNGNWSYQLDRQTKNESSPPPPPPRRPREAASGNLAARPVSPATRRPRNAGPCGSPARRPASRRPATGRSPEAPRLPVGQPDRSPPPLGAACGPKAHRLPPTRPPRPAPQGDAKAGFRSPECQSPGVEPWGGVSPAHWQLQQARRSAMQSCRLQAKGLPTQTRPAAGAVRRRATGSGRAADRSDRSGNPTPVSNE